MNIHIANNTTASNTPLLQIARPAWLLRIEGAILLGGAVSPVSVFLTKRYDVP